MFTEIGYHAQGLAFPLRVEGQDGTILQIAHFYELNGGCVGLILRESAQCLWGWSQEDSSRRGDKGLLS